MNSYSVGCLWSPPPLHADLQILTGWLKRRGQKSPSTRFAHCPITVNSELANARLNVYDLALLNPDLETIARNLTAIREFSAILLRG